MLHKTFSSSGSRIDSPILDPDELKVLCNIAERVLRNRLENLEQSYRICRLCCYEGCTNCPIDAELLERGVDRARNDAL